MGKLVGAHPEARVRCAAHVDVVDAMSWVPPEGVLFDSDAEAMAHFLSDYGDGIDFMQQQVAADEDSDDVDETQD